MKTDPIPAAIRLFLIFFVSSFFALPLLPRGNLEAERAYRDELSEAVTQILPGIESGDVSGAEGKAVLASLREKYNRDYTDFDGMIDALLDGVSEGRLGSEEALNLFREREEARTSENGSSEEEKDNGTNRSDNAGLGESNKRQKGQ